MKKKILLIGAGAEIGSLFISLPFKSNYFEIDTVITRKIFNSKKKNFDAIISRIILSNPHETEYINYNLTKNQLHVGDKKINIFFYDIEKDQIKLKEKYYATILCTSKKHINNIKILNKIKKYSNFVFGVAENLNLPSFYPSLIGTNSDKLLNKFTAIKNQKIFALGSCQTNGWNSHLNALTYSLDKIVKNYKFVNFEVDIVHPDTPTGRLGTKSYEPRSQESRNNFRPSFSQVQSSIKRIFPRVRSINTVSLRTLIEPPGYMISRFFFETNEINLKNLNLLNLKIFLKQFSKKFPEIIKVSELPLGSKAFSFSKEASVILIDNKYLILKKNIFSNNKTYVHEIIFQSYVHNTRGYCYSVLRSLDFFIENEKSKILIK